DALQEMRQSEEDQNEDTSNRTFFAQATLSNSRLVYALEPGTHKNNLRTRLRAAVRSVRRCSPANLRTQHRTTLSLRVDAGAVGCSSYRAVGAGREPGRPGEGNVTVPFR